MAAEAAVEEVVEGEEVAAAAVEEVAAAAEAEVEEVDLP